MCVCVYVYSQIFFNAKKVISKDTNRTLQNIYIYIYLHTSFSLKKKKGKKNSHLLPVLIN